MEAIKSIIGGALIVLYPLGIYFGLNYLEPRVVSILLLAVIILRIKSASSFVMINKKQTMMIVAAIALIILFTVISNQSEALKMYPVIVNLSLFFSFSYTLYYPPPMIERFARLKKPELPDEAVVYTRKLTKVWCVFFLSNSLLALYTSLFSSVEIWTLYNGFIAYLLMACLFIGELIYRKLFLGFS